MGHGVEGGVKSCMLLFPDFTDESKRYYPISVEVFSLWTLVNRSASEKKDLVDCATPFCLLYLLKSGDTELAPFSGPN